MTDTPQPAQPQADLTIDRSATSAVGGTVAGASLILVSGFITLVRLWSARDLDAIQAWVDSNGVVFFLALSTLVSTLTWRITATIRKHRKAVIAADPRAPQVQVKG